MYTSATYLFHCLAPFVGSSMKPETGGDKRNIRRPAFLFPPKKALFLGEYARKIEPRNGGTPSEAATRAHVVLDAVWRCPNDTSKRAGQKLSASATWAARTAVSSPTNGHTRCLPKPHSRRAARRPTCPTGRLSNSLSPSISLSRSL